jgi:hypothetical protein
MRADFSEHGDISVFFSWHLADSFTWSQHPVPVKYKLFLGI